MTIDHFSPWIHEIEEIFSMDPRLNLNLKRVHKKIGACIRPVTILSLSDLTIGTLMTINNPVTFQLKHLERVCLDPWNVGKHFGT